MEEEKLETSKGISHLTIQENSEEKEAKQKVKLLEKLLKYKQEKIKREKEKIEQEHLQRKLLIQKEKKDRAKLLKYNQKLKKVNIGFGIIGLYILDA